MARRRLLGDDVWARLLGPPADELEIARLYSLTAEDLTLVGNRRTDATRSRGYFQQRYKTRHRRSAVEELSPGFLERSIGMQVVVEGAARDVAELSADGRDAA